MTARLLIKLRCREAFADAAPRLFALAESFKNGAESRVATPDTDIVIEGFPRSANSFASHAFLQAQRRPVKLAHHLHLAANVRLGVAYRKPTLVLIRSPEAAVMSYGALRLQVNARSAEGPRVIGDDEIARMVISDSRRWLRFYRGVLPVRDRVCVATFQEIVKDYGKVIDRVNRRFGSDFDLFGHDEQSSSELIAGAQFHLGPSSERNDFKRRFETVTREPAVSAALARLKAESLPIWTTLVGSEKDFN